MIGLSLSQVLKAVATADDEKLLEVSIGLAPQIFCFTSREEQERGFQTAGVTEDELAKKLVSSLKKHEEPSVNVPGIPRFAIELAIETMRSNSESILRFEHCGMMGELRRVEETTSDVESFRVFDGRVGISRHADCVVSLAEKAMALLRSGRASSSAAS